MLFSPNVYALLDTFIYYRSLIPHWVLIVGKEGEEYLMRDPLGEANTVGKVSDYSSKIYAVRIMRQTPRGH